MRPSIVLLALALGACSNTVASLNYLPNTRIVPAGAATIGAVTASDERAEAPRRLATIMGLYGNPLKTLDTTKPVKDEVADAFLAGLAARGMLTAPEAALSQIVLVVRKFDADMIIGRTARVDISMFLVDRSGQTIYQNTIVDSISDTKLFQTGIAAKITDLQDMAQQLLNRTVDRMLDNPRFRAAAVGGMG